jgi:hypothetical protein
MSQIQTSRSTFSQALPLMNIVFGHLVGDFNGYFIPGSNVTKAEFKTSVANNAYNSPITSWACGMLIAYSLYIFYLFIGKFVLTYVSMVSQSFDKVAQTAYAED